MAGDNNKEKKEQKKPSKLQFYRKIKKQKDGVKEQLVSPKIDKIRPKKKDK